MGSEASFGGRDKLLTQHGNFNIEDYNYAKKHGKNLRRLQSLVGL